MKKMWMAIDNKKVIGIVEKEIFGSFVEHLGRSVYNGIYEPTHKTANAFGFRQDVMDLIKDLGVTLLRYPGGNFVSGYDWKKGIGPKEKRPEVVDLAWKAIEPNLVGIDEFASFAQSIDVQLMMAVNLGTGPIQDVSDLVQYCNLHHEGMWAKERIKNGHQDPYNVSLWCLGNEMDGDWQLCSKSAEDYAKVANDAAKIIKWISSDAKVVACGSSSPKSPTFPDWDKVVLHQTFDHIDYLSLHAYYTYPTEDHDLNEYFGSATDFDRYIKIVKQLVIEEKKKRSSNKEIYLSIDEWNIWHTFDHTDQREKDWAYGLPLLENKYDYIDSLVFATLLMTLLNNCDYVKIGCLAQLCNVIAPILTQTNGAVLKQTTYYAFKMLSDYFKGLQILNITSDFPTYKTKTYGDVTQIYHCVGFDKNKNEYIFAFVNPTNEDITISINFSEDVLLKATEQLHHENLHDKNTFDQPNLVHNEYHDVKDDIWQSTKMVTLEAYSFKLYTYKGGKF